MDRLRPFHLRARRRTAWAVAALGFAFASFAASVALAQPGDAKPGTVTPDGPAVRVHLMEGSVISGTLSVPAITVKTAYGSLEIPIGEIRSISPGLRSHPELERRIQTLVQQLAANEIAGRDAAQRTLVDFGPPVSAFLEEFRQDANVERRTRVERILEELASADDADDDAPEFNLTAEDVVETERFTVTGAVSPASFRIATKFGTLSLASKDVRRISREAASRPESRARLKVDATSLPQTSLKDTGLRLKRGDRLEIVAGGELVLTPWGDNLRGGPDGLGGDVPPYSAAIPGGALVARIGRGEEFLVGGEYDAPARSSGRLFLGVAIPHQFASQGYTFPGNFEVRIRVNGPAE